MSLFRPTRKTLPYCDVCKKGYGNGSNGLINQHVMPSGESIKAHNTCAQYKRMMLLKNPKTPALHA